ncbi:MAG: hypothetical protein WCX70_01905, partial [Candidatus Paceibacterota bacterium]
ESKIKSELYDKIVKTSVEYGIHPDTALNIAMCESSLRQYNNEGNTLRGIQNSDDVGVFQINEKYHLEKSRELGYNLNTPEGNIGYAMWLMKKEGTRHWNYSKTCWSPKLAQL